MTEIVELPAPTPLELAKSFATSFRGWANELAMLFGGPLYLVGSSLTSLHPGDRDLRLMLDRETCVVWWGEDFGGPSWESKPGWFARKREELKQSRRMTKAWNRAPGMPRIDFQFQSTLFSELDGEPIGYEGKPRLRLDDADRALFAAGRSDP